MSSDQGDIVKDNNATTGGSVGTSKAFPRNPLEYGSNLLGAGSPSYEARISFKRYVFLLAFPEQFLLTFYRAREIQQQEGVPAIFWSIGGSSNSSPSKSPAEPTIPEGTICLLSICAENSRYSFHRELPERETCSCWNCSFTIHESIGRPCKFINSI